METTQVTRMAYTALDDHTHSKWLYSLHELVYLESKLSLTLQVSGIEQHVKSVFFFFFDLLLIT